MLMHEIIFVIQAHTHTHILGSFCLWARLYKAVRLSASFCTHDTCIIHTPYTYRIACSATSTRHTQTQPTASLAAPLWRAERCTPFACACFGVPSSVCVSVCATRLVVRHTIAAIANVPATARARKAAAQHSKLFCKISTLSPRRDAERRPRRVAVARSPPQPQPPQTHVRTNAGRHTLYVCCWCAWRCCCNAASQSASQPENVQLCYVCSLMLAGHAHTLYTSI